MARSAIRMYHGKTAQYLLGDGSGGDQLAIDENAVTGNRFDASKRGDGFFHHPCHGVLLWGRFKEAAAQSGADDLQVDIYPYDKIVLDALATESKRTFFFVNNGTTYVTNVFDIPLTIFGHAFTPKVKATGANDDWVGKLWVVPYWLEDR